MVKRILLIILIITFLLPKESITTKSNNIDNRKQDAMIGKIVIPKINLNRPLFDIESEENTIEKNITILKESTFPEHKNSIMIIAAHSGTGEIAYFNELDKLTEDDKIVLIIKNKKYNYIVNEIWEERKNGYININKSNKRQLILTTCSPTKTNYQLVINCIEKDVSN